MPPSRKISFTQCVRTSLAQPELVNEFNRLSGHRIGQSALHAPVESAIAIKDVAGLAEELMAEDRLAVTAFLHFVQDFVWARLPADVRSDEADALELFMLANPASPTKH